VASGQTLLSFEAADGHPPNVAIPAATPDVRNGHPVLDFSDAVQEQIDFEGFLPRHYGGGGITVSVVWTATTAVTGTVQWAAAFERHDPATDLDTDHFGAAGALAAVATNPVSGCPVYTDLVFSPASLAGLLPGEHFRFGLVRHVTGGMVGDAELLGIELRET
jgi:hypothetical protein